MKVINTVASARSLAPSPLCATGSRTSPRRVDRGDPPCFPLPTPECQFFLPLAPLPLEPRWPSFARGVCAPPDDARGATRRARRRLRDGVERPLQPSRRRPRDRRRHQSRDENDQDDSERERDRWPERGGRRRESVRRRVDSRHRPSPPRAVREEVPVRDVGPDPARADALEEGRDERYDPPDPEASGFLARRAVLVLFRLAHHQRGATPRPESDEERRRRLRRERRKVRPRSPRRGSPRRARPARTRRRRAIAPRRWRPKPRPGRASRLCSGRSRTRRSRSSPWTPTGRRFGNTSRRSDSPPRRRRRGTVRNFSARATSRSWRTGEPGRSPVSRSGVTPRASRAPLRGRTRPSPRPE